MNNNLSKFKMAIAVIKRYLSRGFTLIEVMLTVGILAFCLCGLMVTYINMFVFSDLSRGFSLASNAIQAKIEEIRSYEFDTLDSYNGTKFDLDGFASSDSEAVIQVDDTVYTDALKRVRIVACFRSRNRLIGEDLNLNGDLDAGEDTNGNARLDSPVEVVTLIVR